MKERQNLPSISRWISKYVWVLVVLLTGAFLLSKSLISIPSDSIGLVTKSGSESRIFGPGVHLKTPFLREVRVFEVGESSAFSRLRLHLRDGQPVDMAINWQYAVSPESAEKLAPIYRDRTTFLMQFLSPLMEESASQVIGEQDARSLIELRPTLANTIRERITATLARHKGAGGQPFIISIGLVVVSELKFSEGFYAAIDRKLVADSEIAALVTKAATINSVENGLQIEATRKWNGLLPMIITGQSTRMPWTSDQVSFE